MKIIFGLALLIGCASLSYSQVKVNSSTFGAKESRYIGPAVMGGRLTAIDVNNNDPRTYYVGSAGGGIWKTTNAGVSFKPIFDKYCSSIGALVVDQKNPETIWAGTGESNMRNSVSVGDGLYKSTDGGSNWKKLGLDSTEHISKIAIDPNNSDVVYVAAPGALWSDSKHRGLYKTEDGGKTWNKIYFVNDKTGCADIIIDPKNSNVLYASMWQFRRTPWSFLSGGKGSGLFKSTDAGKTWKKIQNGFDGEELGRVCLAISPLQTNLLYAIAESKNTALYMSTDGGESWKKKSASMNVTWRPFYFSVIQVDPIDPQRIYRPSLSLSISSDGGESFKEATMDGGWVHSDHHALWINPKNNNHLLLGTDGGLYQSLDKGNSWHFLNNLPVSQFYHVSYDYLDPYNVYGGLQDNGSWYAASNSSGGVENRDWENCGGGDGFWVQPNLLSPNIIYSESQGGAITRYNKKNGQSKDVKPYELAGEPKLRCNWNTPIVSSQKNPSTLYYGAQYLYKTNNGGDSWERISPDLTTNDPKKQKQEESGGLSVDNSGAENHCTIFSICESPLDEKLIWVGTDDGNVQVTTDGGKTWVNVTKNIVGLPACAWVSSIDASPHDKNVAYASFDNHAMGDMRTHVYKTNDLGKTWTSISTSDLKSFAHKIKQDLVNPKLLFAGTEFGLFISMNDGNSWSHYNANLAVTSVRDIQIHPKWGDLILATHGRGIVILDDLTPIRFLSDSILESEMSFLMVRPSALSPGRFGSSFPSDGGYTGRNMDEDVQIVYYIKDRVNSGDALLEIIDKDGKLVTKIPASKRKGINVATWNMRGKPPRVARGIKADFSGFFGPMVAEGTYTAKLSINGKTITKEIVLKYVKELGISYEEQIEGNKKLMEVFALQERLAFVNEKIYALKDSCSSIEKKQASNKALVKTASDLKNKLDKLNVKAAASIAGTNITGEEKIREKIGMLYFGLQSYSGKPTASQLDRLAALTKEVEDLDREAQLLYNKELVALNKQLKQSKLSEFKIITQEEFDKATLKN